MDFDRCSNTTHDRTAAAATALKRLLLRNLNLPLSAINVDREKRNIHIQPGRSARPGWHHNFLLARRSACWLGVRRWAYTATQDGVAASLPSHPPYTAHPFACDGLDSYRWVARTSRIITKIIRPANALGDFLANLSNPRPCATHVKQHLRHRSRATTDTRPCI